MANKWCGPLDWQGEFQKLIKNLGLARDMTTGRKRTHLATYQTAVAIGGYLGTRGQELLHFTWFDLLEADSKLLYEFKTKRRSRLVHYDKHLVNLVESNYQIVDPDNIHDFILENKKTKQPLSTDTLNHHIRKIFDTFQVKAENPTSHTFRKTIALRVYDLKGRGKDGILFVQKMLGHVSPQYTVDYLGISRKEMKKTYLNIH